MSPFLGFSAMKGLLEARVNTLPGPLRILEAGCGQAWPLEISQPHKLIGLDPDPEVLAARADLHEAVIGDLRTVEFPAHSFDVVYSAFMLGRGRGAERVLRRFLRWLAPGGTLILQLPDPDCACGFLTRVTPMWLQVMACRHVLGMREAGTPGHGPYPTHYDRVASQGGLRDFCRRHGLPVPELYRMCSYENKRIVRLTARLTGLLSGGRLAWEHDNLLFVLQTARPAVLVPRNLQAEPARPATVRSEAEPRVA